MDGQCWTHEEFILAFDLYGRIHIRKTDVITLVELIGLRPSTVSYG